ncbi:MAG: hypothetical protein ACOY4F_11005 [Thermodesulfobacteriota bacterium]
MIDTSTVENSYICNGHPDSAVKIWDQYPYSKVSTIDLKKFARAIGLTISLVASPVTVMVDPWQEEKRKRDLTVTMSIYKGIFGRVVTRAEALRIAKEILKRAEGERLAFAEEEAARGIQWESGS